LQPERKTAQHGAACRFGFEGRALESDRCTGLGIGCLSQYDKTAPGAVSSLSKTEPCSKRNSIAVLRRGVAQVEHNGRESSRLEQKIGSAQCLIQLRPWFSLFRSRSASSTRLGLRLILASHPEQLAEVDAAGRGRFRIESVIGIHPGADACLGRSQGKKGKGKAGAP
jgi:hypothetical protein